VLFFIELASRRVHLAGCTANPSGAWAAQQARQFAWSLSERLTPVRFLIHDRDSKFSNVLDEASEATLSRLSARRSGRRRRTRSLSAGRHRPPRLPRLDPDRQPATAFEQVLRVYVDHYNSHRPHRALGLTPPAPERRLRLVSPASPERVHRRDRPGGLIHEYAVAA
jgi:hypothetical protein